MVIIFIVLRRRDVLLLFNICYICRLFKCHWLFKLDFCEGLSQTHTGHTYNYCLFSTHGFSCRSLQVYTPGPTLTRSRLKNQAHVSEEMGGSNSYKGSCCAATCFAHPGTTSNQSNIIDAVLFVQNCLPREATPQ